MGDSSGDLPESGAPRAWSRDDRPWEHPFLAPGNLRRFRDYSESIWRVAQSRARAPRPRPLRVAFAVNMAQNMNVWARLAAEAGASAELYLHPMDRSVLSHPQWEDHDGEWMDLSDLPGFLADAPPWAPPVPVREVPISAGAEDWPCPAVEAHPIFASYRSWARSLAEHDVVYAASAPFAAYASGRAYCVFSVGGDLQFDCGRRDAFGSGMRDAFGSARFLFASNPHTLAHCRRLGISNAVYLPYPIDDQRYSPGAGQARLRWDREYGPGVYALSSARIDGEVKGQGEDFFSGLTALARRIPSLRFVFLAWGSGAAEARRRIAAAGMDRQFILLPPVGKRRLIDYYRSCDFIIDQFVMGYFGATALEAAACGKPVVMRMRDEQYGPLYRGDVAPVCNAGSVMEICAAVERLALDADTRGRLGQAMRAWLVRNHGRDRTMPLLLAMLRMAAEGVVGGPWIANPLLDPISPEERAYHDSRLVAPWG